MFQKEKRWRSRKYLDAAEGQECTMNLPGICNHNSETVVFCHSNELEDGHGMSQKADDFCGFDGCSACHDEFDGRTNKTELDEQDKLFYFNRAMKRTLRRRFAQGVLKI